MSKFQDLINSHPLVLVDFHASWCGPCKSLVPILKELKNTVGDPLKIVKIDVDQHQSLARKIDVRGVPTLILYRSGDKVWRQSGVVRLNQLLMLVERYNQPV